MEKPAAKEHLVLGNEAVLIWAVHFCRAEQCLESLWSMKLHAMAAHRSVMLQYCGVLSCWGLKGW